MSLKPAVGLGIGSLGLNTDRPLVKLYAKAQLPENTAYMRRERACGALVENKHLPGIRSCVVWRGAGE